MRGKPALPDRGDVGAPRAAQTERAGLKAPDGCPLRFGFSFLPDGLVSFLAIQAVAILYARLVPLAPG